MSYAFFFFCNLLVKELKLYHKVTAKTWKIQVSEITHSGATQQSTLLTFGYILFLFTFCVHCNILYRIVTVEFILFCNMIVSLPGLQRTFSSVVFRKCS